MKKKNPRWIKADRKSLDELGPNMRKFAEAGLESGYRIKIFPHFHGIRISNGRRTVNMVNVSSPINNQGAHMLGNNKALTSSVWKENGVYCPDFSTLTKKEFRNGGAGGSGLEYPLVIKPITGIKGEGVVTEILNRRELDMFLRAFFKKRNEVMIEEFHDGLHEFRLLVMKGKILDVVQKLPANVTGNGRDPIKKLIAAKNGERKKYAIHNLAPIRIDGDLKQKLRNQGIDLSYVPGPGENIALKNIANLSAGGEVRKIKRIHPQVRKMALKAAKVLDLDLCGLDLLSLDIGGPLRKGRDVFIEANETPGINLHFDWEKKEMPPIAEKIMREIFK